MAEKEREKEIIARIKERAEQLKYGEMLITLTIHNGRFVVGEIKKETPKL